MLTLLLSAAALAIAPLDADGDGYTSDVDCDDFQALIHPDAIELPNDGVDQNCDGDESCFSDTDGDGYGEWPPATLYGSLDCVGFGFPPADNDECVGFDDRIDLDSDGIPDGCDPSVIAGGSGWTSAGGSGATSPTTPTTPTTTTPTAPTGTLPGGSGTTSAPSTAPTAGTSDDDDGPAARGDHGSRRAGSGSCAAAPGRPTAVLALAAALLLTVRTAGRRTGTATPRAPAPRRSAPRA